MCNTLLSAPFQLEESDAARLLAVKQRQNLDNELVETRDEVAVLVNSKNLVSGWRC